MDLRGQYLVERMCWSHADVTDRFTALVSSTRVSGHLGAIALVGATFNQDG